MTHMTPGQSIPAGEHFISIYYTRNKGVAFSLFDGVGGTRWALAGVQVLLVIAIIVIMVALMRRQARIPILVAIALMLGGGIGNLIDRIAYGSVTDFISVGSFPVFNVADSCLTVGSALLVISLLAMRRLYECDAADVTSGADESGGTGGDDSA
jgi:signal peptidase II